MKVKWMVAEKADRGGGTFVAGFVALAAAAMTLLPALEPAHAAAPGGGPAGKTSAVKLEAIPGSTAKRVTLTAKAAERLGIETGKVSEEPIVRRQMVSGLVITPMENLPEAKPAGGGFGGFGRVAAVTAPTPVAARATSPGNGEAWVLMSLSPAEWERLAKDKPARILPLATRDNLGQEILARPSGIPPIEDAKRSMLTVHYTMSGTDPGLGLNKRVRVELQLAGSDEKHKVVPYGAIYYDAKGAPWVYVNTAPLVFERQRIGVERIVGDQVVLTDGPPVGTPVVTVGAALLFGAEIFGK